MRSQLDTLSLDGLDMGMVVVDPKTGYIKCMVGGYDYNADENHVNHALRQSAPCSLNDIFPLSKESPQYRNQHNKDKLICK